MARLSWRVVVALFFVFGMLEVTWVLTRGRVPPVLACVAEMRALPKEVL